MHGRGEQFDIAQLYAMAQAGGYDLESVLSDRNFGGVATVTPGTGATQQLARVSCTSPWHARPWQVSWSQEQIAAAVHVADFSGRGVLPEQSGAHLEILFGTGASSRHRVEVDIAQGGTLTLTGQEVEVNLIPGENVLAPLALRPLTVAASIAPAHGKKRESVFRTLGPFTLDSEAANSVTVPCPPFSRRLFFVGSNWRATNGALRFFGVTAAGNAGLGTYTIAAGGNRDAFDIMHDLWLPGNTNAVQATVTAGQLTTVLVNFVFELEV